MNHAFDVRRTLLISAPIAKVWDALTNPELIRQYMFGSTAVSEWKQGSPIVFRGEWQGKSFEDKGVITAIDPGRLLQYTYFSPLSGMADLPENYHTITIEIAEENGATRLSLTQDNNESEQVRDHSEKGWDTMLGMMKGLVEK